MGDERPRADLLGLLRELLILERGQWLLEHNRLVLLVEEADPGAVRVAAALLSERVRGLQQPEGGANPLAPAAHPEQAAHGRSLIRGQRRICWRTYPMGLT